jgi:hypothetical protein
LELFREEEVFTHWKRRDGGVGRWVKNDVLEKRQGAPICWGGTADVYGIFHEPRRFGLVLNRDKQLRG